MISAFRRVSMAESAFYSLTNEPVKDSMTKSDSDYPPGTLVSGAGEPVLKLAEPPIAPHHPLIPPKTKNQRGACDEP